MSKQATKDALVVQQVHVVKPQSSTLTLKIVGVVPYVQLRMDEKKYPGVKGGPDVPQGEKKKRKKWNPKAEFQAAHYRCAKGGYGIPASAFRNAMIRAMSLPQISAPMTLGKMSIFIEADDFDAKDGTPLVKFRRGAPQMCKHPVKNANRSTDIRVRAMWREGWKARVKVVYDPLVFSAESIANLMVYAGDRVGIGEGRPSSSRSNGMGWGQFTIEGSEIE